MFTEQRRSCRICGQWDVALDFTSKLFGHLAHTNEHVELWDFVKMAFVFTLSSRWQWIRVEGLGGIGVCKMGVLNRRCPKPGERDGWSWRKGVHTYHCLEEFLKFQIVLKGGHGLFCACQKEYKFKR